MLDRLADMIDANLPELTDAERVRVMQSIIDEISHWDAADCREAMDMIWKDRGKK
jgi:hypothetical protein